MEEIELQPLIDSKTSTTTFTYIPNYWKYILGFICLIILIFTFSYNIYTYIMQQETQLINEKDYRFKTLIGYTKELKKKEGMN